MALIKSEATIPPVGRIWRSYYDAGGVRESTSATCGVVYLSTDRLGSVSVRAWVDGTAFHV